MRIFQSVLLALCFVVIAVMLLTVSGGWSPVRGQIAPAMPACLPLDRMLATLSSEFSERPLFEAVTNDGSRMMVTANPDGTTWSAMTVDHAASACLRIVGTSWRAGAGTPVVPPAGTEG